MPSLPKIHTRNVLHIGIRSFNPPFNSLSPPGEDSAQEISSGYFLTLESAG
jgi:hypothetical protein